MTVPVNAGMSINRSQEAHTNVNRFAIHRVRMVIVLLRILVLVRMAIEKLNLVPMFVPSTAIQKLLTVCLELVQTWTLVIARMAMS